MKTNSLLTLTHLSSLIAFTLISTTSFATTDTPVATFDPVIITNTRLPTKTSNLVAETKVITSDELQRHQGQTLFEVLANQADISIKQNGGMGTASNLYLRGFDSKQILVLIDGIRYSSVSTGSPALNLLPIDQIRRIEILKGASGSSVYGADAMGGVIQIFTKAGFDGNDFSATIGAGTHGHYKAEATAQVGNNNTSLAVSASHVQSKGIDATTANHPLGIHNDDKDGFNSDNVSFNLKHKTNKNIDMGLSALYSQSKVDFDGNDSIKKISYNDTHANNKNGSAQGYINWNYADGAKIKLQYGQSIDYMQTKNLSYPSTYNTTQQQVNITGQNISNWGKAVYGAEYLKQSLDTKGAIKAPDREVKSLFTGYQISKNNFDLQINARHDDNQQYGKQTTYNIGGAYSPINNARIGASYATGFRMPTFNDLYNTGGNVNLKPETSKNAEVFAEYKLKTKNAKSKNRITAYGSEVDDLIALDSAWKPQNIAKTKITGVSLTSDWKMDNYLFGLGYDYQKVVDDKADSTNKGRFINFRPQHKGMVYAGYQADKFDLRAEYDYTGDSYSDLDNKNKLKGYGLLNLSGNYYINDKFTVNGCINNVTDKQYTTTPNYNTLGRNAFVSLTYKH